MTYSARFLYGSPYTSGTRFAGRMRRSVTRVVCRYAKRSIKMQLAFLVDVAA